MMVDKTRWWQCVAPHFPNQALEWINASRSADNEADRLDKLWRAVHETRDALRQDLTPEELIARGQPEGTSEELRRLRAAFRPFADSTRDQPLRESQDTCVGQLLSDVRLAMAGARVASDNPAGWTRSRDPRARETSVTPLEKLFDILFDFPSQRLAVYGSLRPHESNAAQLANVEGHWRDGTVQGIVEQPGEYLEFTWVMAAPPVSVKVLSAARLEDHFPRLDHFEGSRYRRILVPVMIDGLVSITNLYEGTRNRASG
jgi:gamma-glutamylcyclotransferase (GGCT)/AIG2-like uncharacterized protein YtfP